MERILLTAEEAVAASESSVAAESFDAFVETLEKMEPNEVISKYGENVLWGIINVIIGIILANWVIRIIMRRNSIL